MHILIIEDDRAIAENLYEYLEARGHQCDFADRLGTAALLIAHHPYDVAVLDRNLPDGDGLALVRRLRAEGIPLPMLVLTARDTLADKLLGFDAGGDDYLVKPFALAEVEARLQALVRRGGGRRQGEGVLRLGPLAFDGAAQTLCLNGLPLQLPPKALRLAAELLSQPNRVFSRRELEIAVWGHEQASSDSLRSMLHTLRSALGRGAGIQVENVHGLGYKLVER